MKSKQTTANNWNSKRTSTSTSTSDCQALTSSTAADVVEQEQQQQDHQQHEEQQQAKMKSVILYPYGPLTTAGNGGCCRMLHAKNLAITSAIYTINISLLIVLIYSWRINVNIKKSDELEDVYYGVQIAYFAIIGTQMSMIVLSIMLIFGIYKENPGLIVPWIIGYITFMALEAVAMVYSNVLRDHVNKQFDAMCKAEVAFFVTRAFINVLAMWGVLRFYNLVRAGITWRGPEAKTTTGSTHYHHHHLATSQPICAQHNYDSGQCCSKCNRHGGSGGGGGGKRRNGSNEFRRASGCCFFDLDFDEDEDEFYVHADDYDDNDDEYDDDDDDEECMDDDEYGDYYDVDDCGTDDSDCSMLGGKRNITRQMRQQQQQQQQRRHHHGHHHHHHHHHHHRQQRAPRNNNIRSVLINKRHNKYKITQPQTRLEVINESERSAGSGSDENDSLLVAYDSTSSLASV